MSAFQIEKGIPIPLERPTYPFAEMQVGDSFAVAAEMRSRVSSASAFFQRAHPGQRFITRKYNGAYRCWRIA